MLYTHTRAIHQPDRTRLFPRADAAREEGGVSSQVVGVAVHLIERERRLAPDRVDPRAIDPAWTTPVELHHDGSVTARGPIPAALLREGAVPESSPAGAPVPEGFGAPD